RQGSRFLVHENTKAVFNLYYALNLFTASTFTIFYLFELVRLRFECPMVNFSTVLLTKGIAASFSISAQNLLLIISFERLYSALYPAHFEKQSNKKLCIGIAVAVVIMCVSTITSFCMMFFDLYLNLIRKPVKVTSLAVSYQISENRRVLLTMLPIEITQSLLGLLTTLPQFMLFKISSPIGRLMFLELTMCPMLFPIILAIIIQFRATKNMTKYLCALSINFDHF
ncbi:hypothetical protein PMAYCL1PPCAC_13692, partial [Pristionchus mayeri]